MRETLLDIRSKIDLGVYKNEEHVRLAIVARLLSELGWNIWDPAEVNCEFNPVPHEDKKRVDIALFSTSRKPDVFIETKPLGGILTNLRQTEMQLRDYNRDNTAPFSIITDGRQWRFYLSQAAGMFSEKCFKIVDLQDDEPEDIEASFGKFLQKGEIVNGNAAREAKRYLQLSEKQRALKDLLPQARKESLEPPFLRLPDALVSLAAEVDIQLSVQEAEEFIKETREQEVDARPEPTVSPPSARTIERIPSEGEIVLDPLNPDNLHFTKILEGRFHEQTANKWNTLLECAIRTALRKNVGVRELQSLSIPVKRGQVNTEGYTPLSGTEVSYQKVDANRAWQLSRKLAERLGVEVTVRFAWRQKDKAAHPGKNGTLRWPT